MAEEGGNEREEERTEEPSQKRLQKAWQEGQVALSREAVGFSALAASVLAAVLVMPGQKHRIGAAMRATFSRAHEMEPGRAAADWLTLFLGVAWPIATAAVIGAAVATLAQTRGAISAKSMAPDLAKLSPARGLKRILGPDGLLEFLRMLLKLTIVATALGFVAMDLPALSAVLEAPPAEIFAAAGRGILRLVMTTLAAFALVAGVDLLIVRHRHRERLRMSRQDLKEESKESEGDPQIKARMRHLREMMGRGRMLASVPRATVVITNPSHYAVALSYESGKAAAPKLVAKGADAMAARIREAAREAGVPVVADPPLARALFRLDLETEIPNEHWEAVAKIIAYVMRLRGRS
ncbi:EscU/YscU/HrcU family type III secretion system export apparatus switch protein [Roseococcus pinisoli]|uniref:EscU/YscU/HrcU family type III secretion system export apparatus switch protein n=1 Tax=Roseococcus pinisoli TaxID=2835040 RepID=A0ABS5QG25_9PROT|nr:EscU/YscU/HrcU family type III secretion system export apparatus switch protein [Roseococcus pinisoli]MBS7812640.1 EscU/YscU/HrcU family type III secretion system export apparatus switch protein [Roseococcus pinisoli]